MRGPRRPPGWDRSQRLGIEKGHAIAHPVTARSLEAAITIGELGEFGLISAIGARLPQPRDAIVGNGDDAAVLPVPGSAVVASTDLLVEGVHFRRDWSGPVDVGVKAAAQNLADVAAMGALPMALLVGLAAPSDLPVAWALDLASGLAQEAGRAGAYVVGGDLSGAGTIVISVTALGAMAGLRPVTRGGARPSDAVAVAGRLGESAAGLALLRAGLTTPEAALTAHRRPQPPYAAGREAAALGATSMIDISDGLLADLGHVAAASAVRIDIETARLAASAPLIAAAEALGLDPAVGRLSGPESTVGRLSGSESTVGRLSGPEGAVHLSGPETPGPLSWILTGGEDHALAATFPASNQIPTGWVVIGHVREGHGVRVDGMNYRGGPGWRHFR
ncbi:MAG: thiamine-phosphate kinase [Streptosporangiaceae bacterium]